MNNGENQTFQSRLVKEKMLGILGRGRTGQGRFPEM